MKKLIEQQLIQGKLVAKDDNILLDKIGYKDIHWGFRNYYYSRACFKEKEIILEEPITDQLYKGNDLFYYPELAKKIRKIDVYPYLSKAYPVDQEKKGIEFLSYFAQYAHECLQDFKADRLEKYKNLNNLIHLYGYDRYLPLIQKFEEEKGERGYYPDQILTINGVKWYVDDRGSKGSFTGSINLRELLNISGNYRYVMVAQILSGTPFLALKCCMHNYNKGHVFWYDLSTLTQTTKAKSQAWKKTT